MTNAISNILTCQITIPWFYAKRDMNKHAVASLKNSIKRFGPGLITTRDDYELLDGKIRLDILEELGIKKVWVQNYRGMSDLDYWILFRNLHYNWSEIDVLKFSEYFGLAINEGDIHSVASILPESQDEIQNILDLLSFDWKKETKPKRAIFER